MLIQITNRCHMGCTHCMQDATPDGPLMTDETFQQVIDFCREAQPMVVSVTGGEPTEHPQWERWTRQLLQLPSVKVLSLLTNGSWIDNQRQRIAVARLVRESRGRMKVQVYSHPRYYPDHERTVSHEAQFRSIGCIADFNSPIHMQDLGRARQNCHDEVAETTYSPSCINSHLLALQSPTMTAFLQIAALTGKVCRPLIDPLGRIHMSESWLCPHVAHVADGAAVAIDHMRHSRPCRGCRLWHNFIACHPREAEALGAKE